MWRLKQILEQQELLAERVGGLEGELKALRRRLKLEPRIVREIGTVDVGDWDVKASATADQLENWRHYSSRDRHSNMADLKTDIWLRVNHMGVAELAPSLAGADEDEVDLWADGLFSQAIPSDHPCWRATVGRGDALTSYAGTAPNVTWRYGVGELGDPVGYADVEDERVTYGHFACCITDPDSPNAYYFRACKTRRITSFGRSDFWMLTRADLADCTCSDSTSG